VDTQSEGTIRLEWSGGYSFKELFFDGEYRSKFCTPGVYLWLEPAEDRDRILYVGRATGAPDLWNRQWSHYVSYIAGHYQLPEIARPGRGSWEMNPCNRAVLETVFDEASYVQLVRDGFAYASRISVYLCPLSVDVVRRVERQLLYELQPSGTKPGTRTPPEECLKLVHHRVGWLRRLDQSSHNRLVDTISIAE